MNLLVLRLSCALLSRRAGLLRLLLFSLLGAAAAALGAGGVRFFASPAAKLLLLPVMALALPCRGFAGYLTALLALALSALLSGGAVLLLATASGGGVSGNALRGGIGLRAALLGATAVSFLPNIIRRLLCRTPPGGSRVLLTVIFPGGAGREAERIDREALVDTGSTLSDPLTALPVVVLCAKEYPGPAARAAIPIPVRTASGSAVLRALKPDKLFIDGREAKGLIAFSEAEEALVPPSLLEPDGLRPVTRIVSKGESYAGTDKTRAYRAARKARTGRRAELHRHRGDPAPAAFQGGGDRPQREADPGRRCG